MTLLKTDYPVFEADQVLSQKHLNKLNGYLEEQDRMSRVLLEGMGIACGLEINRPGKETITINCGTAITSLGYLVAIEEKKYTHYRKFDVNPAFLAPDLEKHPDLDEVFSYSKGLYENMGDCWSCCNAAFRNFFNG